KSTSKTQPVREFETDQRAHAVTKECERPVEIRKDLASERFDKRLEARVGGFAQPQLTPGQQHRNYFDVGMNLPDPGTENTAAAAGVRKTEQPEASAGVTPHLKPGRSVAGARCWLIHGHACDLRFASLRGFLHFLAETQRSHVSPNLFDVGKALLLRTGLAYVSPAQRVFFVSRPDRVLLFVIHDHFVHSGIFSFICAH